MSRRLPVYLLIDTTGSMKGEPIESVRKGIETMLNTLRQDPYALETVHISIITYDRDVNQLLPLTPIDELQIPEITTVDSGPTRMGAALEMLLEKVDKEVNKGSHVQRGDWKPLLFLMTDGQPTDKMLCNHLIPKVKSKFPTIVCCAIGPKAKTEYLKHLTDNVYQIDDFESNILINYFRWTSGFPGEFGPIPPQDDFILPPPPEGVNIVI